MEPDVIQAARAEAVRRSTQFSFAAEQRLSEYMTKHFRSATLRERRVIEAYLSDAAIRIAASDRKTVVEAEDVKAAIWLYHLPSSVDDPCIAAGNAILTEETKHVLNESRGLVSRKELSETFRTLLRR